MKLFKNLTQNELWELRKQVVLNSYFINDFENTFGFDSTSMFIFFDGYYEYIWELAEEFYANSDVDVTHEIVMENFDNKNNLLSWFNCYDDLSWVIHI